MNYSSVEVKLEGGLTCFFFVVVARTDKNEVGDLFTDVCIIWVVFVKENHEEGFFFVGRMKVRKKKNKQDMKMH